LNAFEPTLNGLWRATFPILFKMNYMNKMILVLLLLPAMSAVGQKIPMTPDHWEFTPGKVTFQALNGTPVLKIVARREQAVLKGVNFANGTIEYDIQPEDPGFNGINFRRQGRDECEYFYLRTGDAGKPRAIDAVQYAPIMDTVLLWDMLPWYQGPASFKKGEWNHIKLVVSGAQMLVYVNDMSRPALEVPRLEGNKKDGSVAFDGLCTIANVVVKPNVTEGLPPAEGFDPTHHDPRYLANWKMSQPAPLPKGRELTAADTLAPGSPWETLMAERRGLVNITRRWGKSQSRRFVWLKVRLKVAEEQTRRVSLGFSDEVWVFINGRLNYADKNIYIDPIRKEPDGRCSIENTTFNLPLKAGVNELLIGVANDFYGWGIIARLDTMEGVELVEE
jgi:hypothetical protein